MSEEHDPRTDAARELERLTPVPPVAEQAPTTPPAASVERGALRRLGSLVVVDVAPLRRHRDFQLLYASQTVSELGSYLTFVAVPYQAYQLTGSSLIVGLVSLAELLPILVVALVGGAFSDAVDRRRLVQVAEIGGGLSAGLLLANSLLAEPRVWLLFVAAAGGAAFYAVLRPAIDPMMPRLVDRDEIPGATALEHFRTNTAAIAAPAVAGLLIASVGVPVTYAIDAGTYAVSLLFLSLMRRMPPPEDADRPSLRGVIEGIRYARSRPELMGTYVVDIVAMLFGMPMALFPAFAEELGGPAVLGLLYAAPSVGSIAASLTSGWTKRVHRHGVAVVLAAGVWGAGVTVFGLAQGLPLALASLAVAGAADSVSGIFRTTIWNQTIPDRLRGRLAGIEMISYTSGPLLGNVESGLVAAFAGIRASAVSGGILCIVGVAAVAVAIPALSLYDSRKDGAVPRRDPGADT